MSSERHSGVLTLLFTDVVGSTALKQKLGDHAGVEAIDQHHAVIRQTLSEFKGAEEIVVAGDSFLVLFPVPSEAVKCALMLQARLQQFNQTRTLPVPDRVGLHLGEVLIQETGPGQRNVHGIQVDTCARVMSLAQAGQILMTRPVFDNARQSLKGEDIAGIGALEWLDHGRFELKGVEEPIELCEVRPAGAAHLSPPTTSEKARRVETVEDEAVLGWRPAAGNMVPNTQWRLEQKLGEGGFGEVWLGRHQAMKERRVFKFCFRADRVRSLKREMTLFRLIKERMGDHPNIVSLREVYFDQPPYYVEQDHFESQDLAGWWAAQGGTGKVTLLTKLEIIAQVADALQAAHDAGVIHRDVKPANILVSIKSQSGPRYPVKLTDFGIGQVISEEALAGVTRAGFTQTMLSSSASHTGTQLYMAPELFAGKPASMRSDIYSLGVVLYQFLLGDFGATVTIDWARRVQDPLLREDLLHCLSGEPEDRFSGSAQLAESLRSYERRKLEAAQRERATRRHHLAAVSFMAAGVLLVLAVCLGYGLNQARHERNHATEQRNRARLEAYAADVKIADTALRENNLSRAMHALRRQLPQPGETDLRGIEWRYLWQQCQGQQSSMFKQNSEVTCAQLSPDGRWLATESEGGFWLWDLTRNGKRRGLCGGASDDKAEHFVFDPRGRFLAAATMTEVSVWSTTNWSKVASLPVGNAALAISADGTKLATFGESLLPFVWDTVTWTSNSVPVKVTPEYKAYRLVTLNRDGTLIALSSGKGVGTEGKRDGEVLLCNVPVGNVLLRDSDANDAQKLAFSDDGRWLAACTWGPPGRAHLWSVTERRAIARWPVTAGLGMALAFAPGGQQLVTAGSDQLISRWQTGSTNRESFCKGHLGGVWSLRFANDGRLVSGSRDGTVRLWTSGKDPAVRPAFVLPSARLMWPPSADFRKLWAINLAGRAVEEWDIETGERVSQRKLQGAEFYLDQAARAVQDNPESSILRHHFLVNWDVAQDPGNPGLAMLATSRQGCEAFAVTGDGVAYGWSPESGALVRSNKISVAAFIGGALTPDGRKFVAVENWSRICSFDMETHQKEVIEEHGVVSAPNTLGPSADGTLLAYRTAHGEIRIWDCAAKRVKTSFQSPKSNRVLLAFSADNRLLATGTDDGIARVWDAATGQPVTEPLFGHLAGLMKVSFSADAKSLVTYCEDYTAKIWNVTTGREMISSLPLNNFLVFHPWWHLFPLDGNSVLESGGEKAIRLVHLPRLAEIDASEASQ